MSTYLVAPRALIGELPACTRGRVRGIAAEDIVDARWLELERELTHGACLIIIGTEPLARLRPLWVDAVPCEAVAVQVPDPAPLALPPAQWRAAPCRGLFVRPERLHVYFGHDEMVRMELVPLLVASGDDGIPRAYPAAWFKHVGPSLAGGRFAGSNWYVFAFEHPLEALPAAGWAAQVEALCDHAERRLAIADMRAHYASYHAGETVLVNVRLSNHSTAIAAARIELAVETPDRRRWTTRWIRRCLNGQEEVTVPWEFQLGAQAGLWRVRAELHSEDRFVYGAGRADSGCLIERSECAVVVAPPDNTGLARPEIEGRSLRIGDQDGFVTGIHYYPSSSWFDWAWRDFRPEKAARDLETMERLGYRLARVWVDPQLDEQALRGLEAWLILSGMRGIVSIVCVFTQWARHLSYPDGPGATSFEFMGAADYNVYSVQLKNVEHQQRYLATLAARWRALPNIIWNLANEVHIVDPDPDQVDEAYFGDVTPRRGPEAGPAYFNRWADLLTAALREAGAHQPVLRGHGFANGGDCYLQNRSGDFLVWHSYHEPETAGPSLSFADPGTIQKPLVLEEFGIPTLDEEERLARYEGDAFWAVVMGAAGMCAYEWGVSWLARELPYTATPLKDVALFAGPDPRWGPPGLIAYADSWPLGSMGLCPWAASFAYGCNYGCTPFPTPAAQALGQVADFCADIGAPVGPEPVLLVVPREWGPFTPLNGYVREQGATIECIQALASAHIPFSVVQEDQLGELAGVPEVLIYPCTRELDAETRAWLDALAAQGVTIYMAAQDAWIAEMGQYAIPLHSSRPVWCLRRGTREGHLYFLFAPEGPTEVVLRHDGTEAALRVSRYALAELRTGGRVRTLIGLAGRRPGAKG